jgi:hypothetical protein
MRIGKKVKKIYFFTLLEICVCLMILSLAAGFLGIHVKDAIEIHRFRNSVARLKIELQKLQMLALCHQSDLKISIYKKKNELYYKASSEEPGISEYACQENKLGGISKLSLDGRKETVSLQMHIYSSGRIEPLCVVGFHRRDLEDEIGSLWLNLTQPVQIKLCESYPGI